LSHEAKLPPGKDLLKKRKSSHLDQDKNSIIESKDTKCTKKREAKSILKKELRIAKNTDLEYFYDKNIEEGYFGGYSESKIHKEMI
jgi:hypothetical protein